MKVLKSGIEVDSKDLTKLRGGSCSCLCNPYVSGTCVNVGGQEDEICVCMCAIPGEILDTNVHSGDWNGAHINL